MFRLSKWYLDCIDEFGDPTIVYTGRLHWGVVNLSYSSVLTREGQRDVWLASEPAVDSAAIRWDCKQLEIDGEWTPATPALSRTVYECDEGNVRWHCLAPSAGVRLNGVRGVGYVEHIGMTVAPWKLPLKTLRWGRVATDTGSIVWIDWDAATRIVYRNGGEASVTALTDDRIDFADGTTLVLDRGLTLRDGPLGSTALSALRTVLPIRLLSIAETKWRSRAVLTSPDGTTMQTWAIHERVTWPE